MSEPVAAPAPGPVEVRLAREGELAGVGALTVAAYEPYLPSGAAYADSLRDARSRRAAAELYVALDEGGRVLGTVTGCPPGSPWRELATAEEGELRMLAVAPPARGRGVATALVLRVLDRAREDGARGMVLCSMAQMAPAHRLYEGLGFRREPGRDWSPTEGVHLLAFTLDLTQPREDRWTITLPA